MSADHSLKGKGKSEAWGGEAGIAPRIPSAGAWTTTMSSPLLLNALEQPQRSLGTEARDEADAVSVDCFKQAFRELRGTIDPELDLDF